MKTIPEVGSRVRVSATPGGWGVEAKTWINTTGIVRIVHIPFRFCVVVGVEFPGWDGGHNLSGVIQKPAGWLFMLQWLEYSGG